VQSTDFKGMVDAAITGSKRRMARGGKVKKPNLTVIIMAPPPIPGPAMQQRPLPPHIPILGALAHAVIMHHAARKLARR
jgi:hypothetical protein